MEFLSSADTMQEIYEELKRRIGTKWVSLPRTAVSRAEPDSYTRPGYIEEIAYHHADLFSLDSKNFALVLGTNISHSDYYENYHEKDISLLDFSSDLEEGIRKIEEQEYQKNSVIHSLTNGIILARVKDSVKIFRPFPFTKHDEELIKREKKPPTYSNRQTNFNISYKAKAVSRLVDYLQESAIFPKNEFAEESMLVG